MARTRVKKTSPSRASSAGSSSSGKITSSHPRFGQQLDRNGVVFARSRVNPPVDLDELLEDLNRQRDSESPSECEYRAYLEVVETSYNEDTMTRAFDSLAKVQRCRCRANHEDGRPVYVTAYNMLFTEAESPSQDGISNPKPDVLEAFTTAAYPTAALVELGGALAPTKHPPAMPAFVVHAKGPNGPMDEAEKQCAYDGSVMVHSAYSAHNYLRQPATAFHGHTQALTVAFNGEDLHIYANHRTQDGKYHSYPVSTEKPRFSLSRYKTARRQLRNAQDWSRRRATRTCDQLWEKTRRDAAIEERRVRQLQRYCHGDLHSDDGEDSGGDVKASIEGLLTPPPSSVSGGRKKREPSAKYRTSASPSPQKRSSLREHAEVLGPSLELPPIPLEKMPLCGQTSDNVRSSPLTRSQSSNSPSATERFYSPAIS